MQAQPVDFQHRIIQNNGQRIYFPQDAASAPPPPHGCEIFIGNLPRNLFETELLNMMLVIGPVYQLRLMMDFSGETRGFAFATFFSHEHAAAAVKHYNNRRIRAGAAIITVHFSIDNRRLFFGNIPRELSGLAVAAYLQRFFDGIVDVILYQEPALPKANRGFAFVEFESHAKAAIARRQMLAGVIRLWGGNRGVFVDWSEPEPIVTEDELREVKILFVSNVPVECQPSRLKHYLLTRMQDIPITRFYKKHCYAFVHFASRRDAILAKELLCAAPITIGGWNLRIEWARPPNYSKKSYVASALVESMGEKHFCLSVPPKMRRLVEKNKKQYMRAKNRHQNRCLLDPVQEEAADSGGSFEDESDDEIPENEMELINEFAGLCLRSL